MKGNKNPTELSDKGKKDTSLSQKISKLTKRLSESDRDALRELFELAHMTLLRFCWRYTRDEEISQDIVQDVFVTLWDKRETLDPNKSLLAFMYTMVRNKALNFFRDSHHSDGVNVDEHIVEKDPGPDEQLDFGMLEHHIKKWIDDLPPRRRQAFKLSRFERLTHAEIAQIMNLTPRTVNTHVMLALRDLRGKLQALQDDIQHHDH